MEPKWNVKEDYAEKQDGKSLVLMEPKWNVKVDPREPPQVATEY